jgi:DNA/RNA-binding domain of Phe-tRNA-synthetase-like protein
VESALLPELVIADDLSQKVRIGLLAVAGVEVREADGALTEEIAGACRALAERFGGQPSGSVPGVEEARRLYKTLGIDPTRRRPSSEALLRRALKGESLYRINTLVDAVNLCSLQEQLPYGLYDQARITPPIELRMGRAGEGYEGIRKGTVHVDGRPVLIDAEGPFGNPTSDSLRTSISLAAQNVLVVVYAPRAFGVERMERVLDATETTLTRHNGGRTVGRRIS